MAGRTSESQSSRPALSTKLSNSVPSTPRQRARHGFGSGSRTPSPRGLNGSHSPRSTISEAVGTLASANKGRSFCKYEKIPTLRKRRMQYNIGDAPLDSPPNKPKKSLDPNEEKKLSGDMRELYDRLLPTQESEERRKKFVEKLEQILRQEWPGNDFKVHIFGSSGNFLCTSDSDVDICIQTPMKELESMHMLAAALDKHGMRDVLCIPAKVPIVKVWDEELKLAADLNVNNTLALENTRMIKTYIQIDERVRPLAMVIKHWTRMRILNDAGEEKGILNCSVLGLTQILGIGGTISSYAWICLILNFLQTRRPPVLPCLRLPTLQTNATGIAMEGGFDDTQESIKGFDRNNKATIGELLFQFFRYYGYEFDYNASVISVRQGKVLTRKEKGWTTSSKDGQWRLCVEEPFNISRNLGNSADATSFRGIHLELRDAFINICNLKLDKLVEEYEFPPEDKQTSSTFKKAATKKATLTPAPAPPNRKSSGSVRHNKHPRGNHSGPSSRRASAGSSSGRGGQGPFSPPLMYTDFNQQMANNWAMLQQHAAHLKQQMYGNVPLHPAQAYQLAVANAQNAQHMSTNIQRENNQFSLKPNGQRVFSNSVSGEHMNGAPHFSQPTMYYTGSEQATPLMQPTSYDVPRTNPSSPSLGTSIPVRRGLQRTAIPNGSASASARSQSQPARGLPQNMFVPIQFLYDTSTAMPYYPIGSIDSVGRQGFDQQYVSAMQGAPAQQADQQPKEYLGYYVDNNTPQQLPPPNRNVGLAQIPSYTDLAHRRDRGNEKLVPLDLKPNRKLSRSPSPLGHTRHSSTPPKSAPLTAYMTSQNNNASTIHASEQTQNPPLLSPANPLGGLLIVNGSSYSADADLTQRTATSLYSTAAPEMNSQNQFEAARHVAAGLVGIPESRVAQEPTTGIRSSDQSPMAAHQPSSGIDTSHVSSTIGSPIQPFPSYSESVAPLMSQEEEVVTSPTRAHHSPWQSFAVSNGIIPHHSSPKEAKDMLKSPGSMAVPFLSPVIESRMPTPQMQRRIDSRNNIQAAPPVVNGNLMNGTAATASTAITNGALPIRSVVPIPPTPAPAPSGFSSTNVPAGSASASSDATTTTTTTTITAPISSSSNAAQSWQTQPQNKRRNGNRKRSKSGPTTRSSGTAASTGSTAATAAAAAAQSTASRKIEPLPAHPQDRKGG